MLHVLATVCLGAVGAVPTEAGAQGALLDTVASRPNRSEVMRELRAEVNEIVTVWANDLRRARDRSPD